jgi:hypothetical protein
MALGIKGLRLLRTLGLWWMRHSAALVGPLPLERRLCSSPCRHCGFWMLDAPTVVDADVEAPAVADEQHLLGMLLA